MGNVIYVTPSAIHEAGHVVMARHFGREDVVVRRHARRGNPGMDVDLKGLDANQIAYILLAGMAAERRMAREWREKKVTIEALKRSGRSDLAFLRWLGIRVLDLEGALDITEELLAERWQEILRTAVAIQQAWDRGQDWTPPLQGIGP